MVSLKNVFLLSFTSLVFFLPIKSVFGLGIKFNDAISTPSKNVVYNILDYGAKGDAISLDTRAINKAIEDASNNGGGTVFFPAGKYKTGSIRLRSNITLHLDNGSVIIAADAALDSAEYDLPEKSINDEFQDFGHSHFHNSLIWGEKVENVAIVGFGTIYGKGLAKSAHYRDDYTKDYRANKSIALILCRNITIRNITIKHGGWFGIIATGVDNLTVDNVTMDTNRDGIDIDCCKNVHISNCNINSPYDDAICLKSSLALGFIKPTENVTIVNCQVSGFDEGTFLDGTFQKKTNTYYPDGTPMGRIKFGTESNGGFKNIAITNCIFNYSRGLALETVDGALLEDIIISNITMRDIVNSPIFIRLGARMRAPDSLEVGECNRIILSNINVYNSDSRFGCIISGLKDNKIQDLVLNNIYISYKGGENGGYRRAVPEYEAKYPEPYNFGPMPSYGFFLRHISNLQLDNIHVSFMNEDPRPGFVLDDISNATINLTNSKSLKGNPALEIQESENIRLYNSFGKRRKAFRKAVKKVIK